MELIRWIELDKQIRKIALKYLFKLQILEKNNEPFYSKNASLKVTNFD